MEQAWSHSPQQVLEHFQVNHLSGLTEGQVIKHRELYGKNGELLPARPPGNLFTLLFIITELPEDPPTPLWELILEQFKDQLVLILLASAVISFVLALFEDSQDSSFWSAFVEPAVILLILIANATVGVIQESKAESAIDVSTLTLFFYSAH
jgi:Ca2+ transporting ATPase